MDKPLSQERLSEEELNSLDEVFFRSLLTSTYERWLNVVSEIKRLQAIEAERDRYKVALENSLNNTAAVCNTEDYGFMRNAIYKALIGVDTNE